jgi:histidine triad (HIT) family protein
MSTIFTKIINKEIPADILFEDNDIIAFKDINPQAPFHILIIPKTEISTTNDLQPHHDILVGKMIRKAGDLAKSLGFAEDGYRLAFNCNKNGGQEVYHIHLHLMGGRKFNWPAG